MRRTSEKGQGRMGGFILLIALLVGALAAWNVAPAYFDHYDFVDKVNEICRMPKYRLRGDDAVLKMLMDEVTKRKLQQWIGPDSFTVNTTDFNRTIDLYYEREVDVLPGVYKYTIKFHYLADQPLV